MQGIKYHGKLPNPFMKPNGEMVSKEEWGTYKKDLLAKIVDIEYGGMPPRPEYVEFERLNEITRGHSFGVWYKVYAGTKEKQLSFLLELTIPYVEGVTPSIDGEVTEGERYPVLLTGDACYKNMEGDVINEINSRGMIAARFNRLEIANDIYTSREGGIHNIYPGNYSDISAWAWGYMVCMDVFERISYTDEKEVAITGHSRGGKTVMLAAAVDDRFKYVCPNNSGCHGAVSHRCEVEGTDERMRTETIKDMFVNFPIWMGEKLKQYQDNIDALPYDMHYFGAMIAPRYYLQCEGMQDYWINPVGAWQNFMAVKECYKYLGCEEHAGAWFRPGAHRHKLPDYIQFIDFVDRARKGKALSEHLQTNPYPEIKKNFDWSF